MNKKHSKSAHIRRMNIFLWLLVFALSIYCGFSQARATSYKLDLDAAAQASSVSASRICVLEEQNEELSRQLAEHAKPMIVDSAPRRSVNVPLDDALQDYIWILCQSYDIVDDYELIYAVIQQESRFQADAISSTDDWGLMQINRVNHSALSSKLSVDDFLDPYQNVHCGIYMLSSLLHKYNTTEEALMAYNLGERGAARLWNQGIYTTPYTDMVLKHYNEITRDI